MIDMVAGSITGTDNASGGMCLTGIVSGSGSMACSCAGWCGLRLWVCGRCVLCMAGVGRSVLDNGSFRIRVGTVMTATDSDGIGETELWYA